MCVSYRRARGGEELGCAAARRIAPKFPRATWLQPILGNVVDSTLSKKKGNHGETVVSQRLLAACCGAAQYLRAVRRLHIALVNLSCHALGLVTLMNE